MEWKTNKRAEQDNNTESIMHSRSPTWEFSISKQNLQTQQRIDGESEEQELQDWECKGIANYFPSSKDAEEREMQMEENFVTEKILSLFIMIYTNLQNIYIYIMDLFIKVDCQAKINVI